MNAKSKRDANEAYPPPAGWAVVAYRWGWLNGHHYIVTVAPSLDAAIDAADAHAFYRGGKYGVTVYDSSGKPKYHARSIYLEKEAHTNYRVEMFESVGLAVVTALESGKPLTQKQIVAKWRRERKMQVIMEKASGQKPNATGERPETRSEDA